MKIVLVKSKLLLRDSFVKVSTFFKKKTPKGDQFPYRVHDDYTILGEGSGYERFYLVGRNWEEKKDAPIAIVLGCNDWKFGFIAEYLNEYRLAFLPRKDIGFSALKKMWRLKIKPERFFIWSYTEKKLLSRYITSISRIPISRLEDGFIRSSALGASHATPYSLVVDNKDLYFNSYKETDLENLLNNFDTNSSPELRKKSKELLELIISEKFSKYNPPINSSGLKIKTKKIVAVLGQVDSDASIRYGNPDNWSAEELIQLARQENPEAEILYRPHPEIYKGYQKGKFKRTQVEHFAKLVSPDEHIIDFIDRVDHVYTITSLTGFEAVIRGKKVTVVGAPFYAGWGVTDDRCSKNLQRRKRKQTVLELFTIAYLVYPRYLANLNDSYKGLFAACCRIKADQLIEEHDYYQEQFKNSEVTNLLASKYFVKLLFSNDNSLVLANFSKINFESYLKGKQPKFFQKIFLLSVFGVLRKETLQIQFLKKVRNFVDYDVFHEVLLILNQYRTKTYLTENIIWLMSQSIDFDIDKSLTEKISSFELSSFNHKTAKKIDMQSLDIYIKESELVDTVNSLLASKDFEQLNEFLNFASNVHFDASNEINETIYSHYAYTMEQRKFPEALNLAEFMLVNGLHTKTMLSALVNLAKLRFDFESTRLLAKLNQNIDLYSANRNMSLAEINSYGSQDIVDLGELKFTFQLAKLVALKPNAITSTSFVLEKFKEYDVDEINQVLESTLYLDNEQSIRKAQAFIAIDRADLAVKLLETLIEYQKENIAPALVVAYTQALSFNQQLDQAIYQIENALQIYRVQLVFEEAIRLYIVKNDYEKCFPVLNLAEKNKVHIGEMYFRKVYFGLRKLNKAFETFLHIPVRNTLLKYYSSKYLTMESDFKNIASVTLLSFFGPGDEIRFASIYAKIINLLPSAEIHISCSPKLFSLFNRAYPAVKFTASEKLRDSDFDYSPKLVSENYSLVKGFDLLRVLDNNSSQVVEKTNKLALVTDFLHKVLVDYSSFAGGAYLSEDSLRKDYISSLLPRSNLLIGLSWRSSLTTHSRNEHYLTVEELEPLFQIDGIQFVNLQYDDCADELAWVEQRYPGKLFNLEELDQYNDLDGVAALLKCMDLVIAPATTVVELSGALGCPTWMFSNSSEIDWRKIDEDGTDVWHNSIKIVDVEEKGNKALLVNELFLRLSSFAEGSLN
jgi:capsular polysaccharide export protein